MRCRSKQIVRFLFLALMLAGIAFSLLPPSWLPSGWSPFESVDGEFTAGPVRLTVPGSRESEVPVSVEITMDDGVCETKLVGGDGGLVWTVGMGEGTLTDRGHGGDTLVLDGQGGQGEYHVFLGSQWHLLAPRGRRILLCFFLGGLVGSIAVGRLRPRLAALGRRRLAFAAGVIFLTGAVGYSVVHELGHALVGTLLGGRLDGVVWTVFSGEEPHVSFAELPADAGPWMGAGGILLPTVLGVVLVGLWFAVLRRSGWYVQAGCLLPGLVLLLCNVGLFVETPGHLSDLTRYCGIPAPLDWIVEVSPALLSLLLFGLVAATLRRQRTGARVAAITDPETRGG